MDRWVYVAKLNIRHFREMLRQEKMTGKGDKETMNLKTPASPASASAADHLWASSSVR